MPLLPCQMFTLYLPPTIVVSYRGIEDSIRYHTTLWTGSSLGNYRLGAETSLPSSLDGLVSLAIRVDARLQQRGQRARRASADNRLDHLPIPYRDGDISFGKPEPMQMGRPRLSLEEKRRRRNEGLCLYCGAAGHIAAQCPVKARETAVKGLLTGGITLAKSSLAATLLTVKLQWSSVTYDCQALIDSGD